MLNRDWAFVLMADQKWNDRRKQIFEAKEVGVKYS